jgi:hypothetical protein
MSDKNKILFFKLIKHSFFYGISFEINKNNKNYSISSNYGKKFIISKINKYLVINDINKIKKDIFNFLKTNVIRDDDIGYKIKLISNNVYKLEKFINNLSNRQIINHYNFIIKKLRSKLILIGGKKKKSNRKTKRKTKRKRTSKKYKKTKRNLNTNKKSINYEIFKQIDSMILIILILNVLVTSRT